MDYQPRIITGPTSERPLTLAERARQFVTNKYGATVVSVTTAAGLLAGCTPASSEPPASGPVAVETAGPVAPDAEPIGNETTPSYELSAELTSEELALKTRETLTNWVNANTQDPALQDELLIAYAEGDITTESEFFTPIATETAKAIADDLFIEGWEQDQKLSDYVGLYMQNNLSTMETWSKTLNSGNSADEEPYQYSATIDGEPTIVSETADTRVVSYNSTEYVNIDKNRGLELNPSAGNINGNETTTTITYKLVGKAWKIAGFETISR